MQFFDYFFHRSIESYTATGFSVGPLFKAVGEFIGVFGGSFILGGFMGLLTALVSFELCFLLMEDGTLLGLAQAYFVTL